MKSIKFKTWNFHIVVLYIIYKYFCLIYSHRFKVNKKMSLTVKHHWLFKLAAFKITARNKKTVNLQRESTNYPKCYCKRFIIIGNTIQQFTILTWIYENSKKAILKIHNFTQIHCFRLMSVSIWLQYHTILV